MSRQHIEIHGRARLGWEMLGGKGVTSAFARQLVRGGGSGEDTYLWFEGLTGALLAAGTLAAFVLFALQRCRGCAG